MDGAVRCLGAESQRLIQSGGSCAYKINKQKVGVEGSRGARPPVLRPSKGGWGGFYIIQRSAARTCVQYIYIGACARVAAGDYEQGGALCMNTPPSSPPPTRAHTLDSS